MVHKVADVIFPGSVKFKMVLDIDQAANAFLPFFNFVFFLKFPTDASKSRISSLFIWPAGEHTKVFITLYTFLGKSTVAPTVFDHGNGIYEAVTLLCPLSEGVNSSTLARGSVSEILCHIS